jgi:hypothetical protein
MTYRTYLPNHLTTEAISKSQIGNALRYLVDLVCNSSQNQSNVRVSHL